MKKVVHIKWGMSLLAGVLLLGTMGCSTKSNAEPKESNVEKEVKQALEENVEAFNKEDLDGYLDTLSSEVYSYEISKKTTKQMFEALDLKASLKKVKVLSYSDDYATVEVKQETKSRMKNEYYKDNVTESVHTLDKEGKKWKIKSTAIKSIKTLDGKEIKSLNELFSANENKGSTKGSTSSSKSPAAQDKEKDSLKEKGNQNQPPQSIESIRAKYVENADVIKGGTTVNGNRIDFEGYTVQILEGEFDYKKLTGDRITLKVRIENRTGRKMDTYPNSTVIIQDGKKIPPLDRDKLPRVNDVYVQDGEAKEYVISFPMIEAKEFAIKFVAGATFEGDKKSRFEEHVFLYQPEKKEQDSKKDVNTL
ncbi:MULTISPECIES: hypothetical protein [Bacillus]|uniref:hypothetical protein n=1 Tax=Bacillus TaxID=1386 RepID=UPI00047BA485|nr:MULTISPECIES: hypothetical protein [Bacillus]WIY61543.1 hypothetical protein QRY57_02780 [Bacillus arachidis]SDZ32196.1 hypothetical protein SAMN04488156_11635 [Bacillus sp. 166amftsu]